MRENARSIRRSDPKPHATAIVSTLSLVSSNLRRARSMRTRSTKSAGLMFKPARNKRLSERRDTPASSARTSFRQSKRGWVVIFSASFRRLVLSADWAAQFCRELALAARSDAKDNMPSRNGQRDLATEIRLDHRKCEIHASGDPGRGPNAAILDVNGIAVDHHRGPKALQSLDFAPMGRGPSAVQSSCGRQEKCPAANRCDPGHPSHRPRHDAGYFSARKFLSHARLATNRDECVDASQTLFFDLRERSISDKTNAGRRHKRSGAWGGDLDTIRRARQLVIGARKHLQRADDVEQLAMRKRQ